MVIAGLDGSTAARALRWGENHGVPVVALVPGSDQETGNAAAGGSDAPASFGFVLGVTRADVLDVLARAAPDLLTPKGVPPIIDASEAARFPPQGGKVGPLTVDSPISCDVPPVRAGDPRFPVADWTRAKKQAWLVTGSPVCAADVVSELVEARSRGVVALTLEAAALFSHPAGLRVVSAAAGVVPSNPMGDPRQEELMRFTATLGKASWWTALGRDAATVARVALLELPVDTVSDARSVGERRARARDLLASARARLWTTEASSWANRRTMKRTVCALDAPIK
jgi:hypothetical protein